MEMREPRLEKRYPLMNSRLRSVRDTTLKNTVILVLLFLQMFICADPGNCEEYEACDSLYLPLSSFQDRNRCSDLSKRSLDGFGAYRKAGHKHAGLDIRADFGEAVFPIGKGKVRAIYSEFPYLTVIIEHRTPAGEVFYSSYTHIEDISVKEGDSVDETTPVCRAFNRDEFAKSGFDKNHIHLEIRKTIDDYKRISIHCYTEDDLNRYFYDPLVFISKYPGK